MAHAHMSLLHACDAQAYSDEAEVALYDDKILRRPPEAKLQTHKTSLDTKSTPFGTGFFWPQQVKMATQKATVHSRPQCLIIPNTPG